MTIDIHELYITPQDLKSIVDLNNQDLMAYNTLKSRPLTFVMSIAWILEPGLLFHTGHLIKWNWFRKRQKTLLEQIDKYNTALKAIDINEQLVNAGNTELRITGKEKVVDALKTTRENLICALKTEVILRKNKGFISRNRELLASNLAAIQTFKTSHEADEYTKVLDEALQVAEFVQGEMKKIPEN
jgi:dsDNA-binding SOS-regulon protein